MLIGFGGNIANIITAATMLTTGVAIAIPFPHFCPSFVLHSNKKNITSGVLLINLKIISFLETLRKM